MPSGNLTVAVFGDSNWENGNIAQALQTRLPDWTFVNIAQGGSGKAIPAMLNLDPPIVDRLSDQGPFDAVILGVGTNDGRCNQYVQCDAEPLPADVASSVGDKPSWCGPAPAASVDGVSANLTTMLDTIVASHPDVVPIVVGPAPTYEPSSAGLFCSECGCGYSVLSQPFMLELTEAFSGLAAARGALGVDIHTPLTVLGDDGADTSLAFPDGVHFVGTPQAVNIAAETIADALTAAQ